MPMKASIMLNMPRAIDEYVGASTMPRTTAYNLLIRRGLAVRHVYHFYSQRDIKGEKLTEYGRESMEYAAKIMHKYQMYINESYLNVISKNVALDESTLNVVRQLAGMNDVSLRRKADDESRITNIKMAGMGLGLGFIHDIVVDESIYAIVNNPFSKESMNLSRMVRRIWSAADLDMLDNPKWSIADLEKHAIRKSELLGMVCSDVITLRETSDAIYRKRPTRQDIQNPELLDQITNEKDNDKRSALMRKINLQYIEASKIVQEYESKNRLGWANALW